VSFYRPYLALFGAIFCCLLGVGASLATLPFYVLGPLHGNKIEVGVVVTAIAVAAVVTRPVAGRLADRNGYKMLMLAGTVTCVLAGLAYFAAAGIVSTVAVRILHGIGEGTVYTAGAAWLVLLSPAARRGRVVGLYGICMWLGITLGALLGTVALRVNGFTAVWWFCLAAPVLGVALVLVKAAPEQPPATAKPSIFPRTALLPGIALSLAALGYAALSAFVALHLAARGIGNGIAAFNAYGFTYVGVRLFIGNLPDRLGPNRVAIWSALVEAVGLLTVAVAPNLPVAIAGGLIMGAGLSLLFPSLALLVINQTDKSQQGAALGTFTSFWDIGLAVGGPAAGLIASVAGYPAIFYAMLGCAVASAAVTLAQTVRRAAPAAEPVPVAE
jgi:MFS family permease